MRIQKSFKNNQQTLYIIPTPIGNLEDITLRSLRILKEDVDVLLCEDTRHTRKLLNKYETKIALKSYHEFNKEKVVDQYISEILAGNTYGLVSDAGMPGISDPGYDLIQAAIKMDINVVVLPGPSAFLVALVRSNLGSTGFKYKGFLSTNSAKKNKELKNIFEDITTTVIYESPHKLISTLKLMLLLDSARDIFIAREITKINEEYVSGTVSEILAHFESNSVKGEFTIIISPKKEILYEKEMSVEEHVILFEKSGMQKKEAIKKVAKLRGLKKNDVYKLFIGGDDE